MDQTNGITSSLGWRVLRASEQQVGRDFYEVILFLVFLLGFVSNFFRSKIGSTF
jgi:hypothetical protein